MLKKFTSIALTMCALPLMACTEADEAKRPAPSQLKQGLNTFNDDSTSLAGAFVKGDRAVYFETRRGVEIPGVYSDLDPDSPRYEMDVRVLDENGRLIYAQIGGDGFIDPQWGRDLNREAGLPRVDPLRRADDFALVGEATEALTKLAVQPTLVSEQRALVSVKQSIRPEMLRPAVERSLAENTYAPGNNSIELHKKSIFAGLGEHSATWANINGSVFNSCNHGSCASTMGYACTATGTGGVDYHEYSQSNGSVNSPACTTAYNWSSNGNHNCHDDSIRQIWGVRFGSQGGGTSGVCNNTASHYYAPSCTVTTW